jgi:hypothetical protein
VDNFHIDPPLVADTPCPAGSPHWRARAYVDEALGSAAEAAAVYDRCTPLPARKML